VLARKKLMRPRIGRKVAGVCLGFSEYFDLDVSLMRLVVLLASIFTGVGFIAYIVAWIVMPETPEPQVLPAGASVTQHTA
jgi:phage shock protein PspC (stress-responsive transcriptional regulator)